MNPQSTASIGIQAVDEPVAAQEIESTRARVLLNSGPDDVCHGDRSALSAMQALLGHGAFGTWTTPRRWCTTATDSKLNVDLRSRIVARIKDDSVRLRVENDENRYLLDRAVELLTRYLLVLRIGPAGSGRKGAAAPLDPSTIADLAYHMGSSLFIVALERWITSGESIPPDKGFLSIVRAEDYDTWTASQREAAYREARRMHVLNFRGWWHDLPGIGSDVGATTPVKGDRATPAPERKRDSHLPLPDDYVSEMGKRSLWLIETLAPPLLEIAAQIERIWVETDDGGLPASVSTRRRARVARLLAAWEWKDASGIPIHGPPFPLRLSRSGHKATLTKGASDTVQWPPATLAGVLGLLSNVQLAHLFVVSLSTGGRKSETLDLRRGCIEYARDGRPYASGRTFKLVQRHEGEMREWVLPDLAVAALEQQVRLVRAAEVLGTQKPSRKAAPAPVGDHLWAQVSSGAQSDRTQPLRHLDKAMRAYAKAIGMDEKPSGQYIRPHRFRKTVARLAALALTQAPKILMDVFGHKSIEMTLYYILADESLQAEIEQVGRELRVMRASEAVSAIVAAEEAGIGNLDLGSYGGPAALMVKRAVQVQRERVHRRGEQWGAANVRELAEILTLQGKAWEVVRQGVLCTKFPGSESGPCNRSKGRPEPSHCQTGCQHRLEEAFMREDVDESIASVVQEFETSVDAGDELMQAMWAGQIRAHIGRFEDLRLKWMANPFVQRALAANDETDEVAA